jgi:hypothetical protein
MTSPQGGSDLDETPAAPTHDDDREAATTLAGCVSLFVAQLPSPYREAITLVELEPRPEHGGIGGSASPARGPMRERNFCADTGIEPFLSRWCDDVFDLPAS